MDLTPDEGFTRLDIDERFRREIKGLPERVCLVGNEMLRAVATDLLQKHSPHIMIDAAGTRTTLLSLEQFGARFLGVFMEAADPPEGPFLLHTIPEQVIVGYAEKKGFPIVREEKDKVRKMLDGISAEQPQTYFALVRSAQRLEGILETLRKDGRK